MASRRELRGFRTSVDTQLVTPVNGLLPVAMDNRCGGGQKVAAGQVLGAAHLVGKQTENALHSNDAESYAVFRVASDPSSEGSGLHTVHAASGQQLLQGETSKPMASQAPVCLPGLRHWRRLVASRVNRL